MQHKTSFNLDQKLRELGVKNEKHYDKSQVARLSGVSRVTINKITNNSSARIDLDTISRLLDFFHAEGMPIEIGDLFSVERG
jgi:transcriptional regulator with XRE-family HTH domain